MKEQMPHVNPGIDVYFLLQAVTNSFGGWKAIDDKQIKYMKLSEKTDPMYASRGRKPWKDGVPSLTIIQNKTTPKAPMNAEIKKKIFSRFFNWNILDKFTRPALSLTFWFLCSAGP